MSSPFTRSWREVFIPTHQHGGSTWAMRSAGLLMLQFHGALSSTLTVTQSSPRLRLNSRVSFSVESISKLASVLRRAGWESRALLR